MAGQPVEFTIKDMRKMPTMDRTRMGQWDWLVTYELDPQHVYTIMAPVDGMTDDKLKAAIKADIQERGKWLGQKFRV